MSSLRKNVASQNITFQLINSSTGAAVTSGGAGNYVIDNGTQTACAGTFTHKGGGQWNYAPTQAETNGTAIGFQFTGTGAIPINLHFFTDNWDTTQPVVTSGTGTDQLHVSSGHVANVDTLTTYTGNTPQTGDAFGRLGAPAGASVSADVAAVKSDTGTILTDVNTGAGAIYTRLGAPAGASMSADIAALKTDLDAGVNLVKVNGDATAAQNVAHTMKAIGRGTVTTGATTSSIPTSAFSPAGTAIDQFKGRIITFDADTATAALQGQATDITGSTGAANPTFTCTALTTAPSSGDTFSVT